MKLKLSKIKVGKTYLLVGGAVLIGVGGGLAISKALDSSNQDPENDAAASLVQPAAEFRTDLVKLGVEHVNLVNKATNAVLDRSDQADAAKTAVYANAQELADAIGGSYSTEAQEMYRTAWKTYVDQLFEYTKAAKANDETAKNAAIEKIRNEYSLKVGDDLLSKNSNLQETLVKAGFEEQVAGTLRMIDAHAKGDFTSEVSSMQQLTSHVEAFFTVLVEGAVKHSPDRFNR